VVGAAYEGRAAYYPASCAKWRWIDSGCCFGIPIIFSAYVICHCVDCMMLCCVVGAAYEESVLRTILRPARNTLAAILATTDRTK
jgi:hypothetical protein